jgi:probable F420-dependent oxidoreductase
LAQRAFRFGIQAGGAPTGAAWRQLARKAEDLGYSSLLMPDHFTEQLAPIPALVAAADETTSLRLGMLVLGNDYRHPVVLAKEAATLDLLSDGRLEFGIGAGWMRSDYEQAGMPYERPGVRIERLSEALTIMRGLFTDGPVSHAGQHYTVTNYEGLPKPAQKPHPPFLIGGGGKRMLSLAAREADIISVNFNLAPGAVNRDVMITGDAASTDAKIGWVQEAAGARFDDIELNVVIFILAVTDDREGFAERMAPVYDSPAADVLDSPHLLAGTIEQMVETLQARRERYGFTYICVQGDQVEAFAPVVKRLAGT